jgi:hypothetical protein
MLHLVAKGLTNVLPVASDAERGDMARSSLALDGRRMAPSSTSFGRQQKARA